MNPLLYNYIIASPIAPTPDAAAIGLYKIDNIDQNIAIIIANIRQRNVKSIIV